MKQTLKDKYLNLFSTYNIPLARTNKQILERFSSETAPESDPDIADVKYVPSSKTYNYKKRVKDEYYQYQKTIEQYLKSTIGGGFYDEYGLNTYKLLQLKKVRKLTQRDIDFLCELIDILTFNHPEVATAAMFALKNQAEFVRFLEERREEKEEVTLYHPSQMKQLTRLDMKYKAFLEDAKVKSLDKEYEIKYVQTKEAPKIDKDIIGEVKYDRVTKEFCYSKKIDTGNFNYETTIKKYLKDNFGNQGQGIVIPYHDNALGIYGLREVIFKRDIITEKQVWILELLLKHDLIKTQYKNVLRYLIKAYKVLNNIPISLDPE